MESDEMRIARLEREKADLLQWIQVLMDQVDYTKGNCSPTDLVGAVLDVGVIDSARQAITRAIG